MAGQGEGERPARARGVRIVDRDHAGVHDAVLVTLRRQAPTPPVVDRAAMILAGVAQARLPRQGQAHKRDNADDHGALFSCKGSPLV